MTTQTQKIAIDHTILLALHNSDSKYHEKAIELMQDLTKNSAIHISQLSLIRLANIFEEALPSSQNKKIITSILQLYSKHPHISILPFENSDLFQVCNLFSSNSQTKFQHLLLIQNLISQNITKLYSLSNIKGNFDNFALENPFSK